MHGGPAIRKTLEGHEMGDPKPSLRHGLRITEAQTLRTAAFLLAKYQHLKQTDAIFSVPMQTVTTVKGVTYTHLKTNARTTCFQYVPHINLFRGALNVIVSS